MDLVQERQRPSPLHIYHRTAITLSNSRLTDTKIKSNAAEPEI